MTVTLNLNLEIEQGLLTQARERGVSLDADLQRMFEKRRHRTRQTEKECQTARMQPI